LSPDNDTRRSLGLIGGGAIAVIGAWLLVRRLGFVPVALLDLWWRVALALVIAASRGGLHFTGPRAGARLYKSRTDKWVDGVLGGLGHYLGIDPVLLRLAFIVLLIAGWGALIVAYIIMAIIVPREPEEPTPPAAA
jgi:phage shock protein C